MVFRVGVCLPPGRQDRRVPTRTVNPNEKPLLSGDVDHSFRAGSAVRVTPPETMNARVSAASADIASTWSAGTSTTRPAKLYDQGRYTATCPGMPRCSRLSAVTKPRYQTAWV